MDLEAHERNPARLKSLKTVPEYQTFTGMFVKFKVMTNSFQLEARHLRHEHMHIHTQTHTHTHTHAHTHIHTHRHTHTYTHIHTHTHTHTPRSKLN